MTTLSFIAMINRIIIKGDNVFSPLDYFLICFLGKKLELYGVVMLVNSDKDTLFLGIDGGGSKCKAVVMNQKNEILGSGISGPGNPLYGFEQAINSIETSAVLALKDAGLSHLSLNELNAGVGLAGVNLPAVMQQMKEWQHPFKQIFLAHDLLIACLGAHHQLNGAVIITGTGSCGYSYINNEDYIIGGHGFPQGDKGSGSWFGLQATQMVLKSLEGFVEPTMMNELLLEKLSCTTITEVIEKTAGQKATFFAQLAKIVFLAADQGDDTALAIVKEGAAYIDSLAKKLLENNPARLSLLGGLTPVLQSWLAPDIQAQLSEPLSPPEVGAVYYAKSQLEK